MNSPPSKVGELSFCPPAPADGSQRKHPAAFNVFTDQADFSCQRDSRLVGPQISPTHHHSTTGLELLNESGPPADGWWCRQNVKATLSFYQPEL